MTAVHGMCAGGAQYFLNESDIIVCADDAEFFDPHANGGIVSALEPIGMLARGVPVGDVLRWALMGTEERITAGDRAAHRSRHRGRPAGRPLGSRPRHRRVDRGAQPVAIQGTVRAIWESLDMTRTMALQNGMAYTHIGNASRAERAGVPRRNDPPTYR